MSNTSLYTKKINPADIAVKAVIWISAFITLAVLISIVGHVLARGLPHINTAFITGTYSELDDAQNGILPMIINTLYAAVITLLISLPIGLAAAIYLTQYARRGLLVRLIRFCAETMAGIPSIIYGLLGYAVFCVALGMGFSIIAGCLTMAICVLPVIIRTAEESLIAVPPSYGEGGAALGANKIRVILTVILPAALPGILTAIVLALGRIVGETAALWYTIGAGGYNMPEGVVSHITQPGRTLSLHLYQSASLGTDPLHVPYATASVLIILVFCLNRIAGVIRQIKS